MATGYSLGALVDRLFDIVYPIGICIDFDSDSVDPNVLFPGTVWARITDNSSFRSSDGKGMAGTLNGSDDITLTTDHLPAHSHAFSRANIGSTDLGTKTTSSFDHGNKSTSSSGNHTHSYLTFAREYGGSWGFYANAYNGGDLNTSASGDHNHTVAIGAHSHTVVIGEHSHTLDISIANSGAGKTFWAVNRVHYYARWKRTA